MALTQRLVSANSFTGRATGAASAGRLHRDHASHAPAAGTIILVG